jgi:hypothetical protein
VRAVFPITSGNPPARANRRRDLFIAQHDSFYMATVSECALNRTTSRVGRERQNFQVDLSSGFRSQILINLESHELEVVEFGVPSAWPFFARSDIRSDSHVAERLYAEAA